MSEIEALVDALVEATREEYAHAHTGRPDKRAPLKDTRARLLSAVALLRERAGRAEAEVAAFRFYSDEFCQREETAEQAAHAMFDAVVAHRLRAARAEARASAAESECERLRGALEWCIEGHEGAVGPAFWHSPLGKRLTAAGFGHPDPVPEDK